MGCCPDGTDEAECPDFYKIDSDCDSGDFHWMFGEGDTKFCAMEGAQGRGLSMLCPIIPAFCDETTTTTTTTTSTTTTTAGSTTTTASMKRRRRQAGRYP